MRNFTKILLSISKIVLVIVFFFSLITMAQNSKQTFKVIEPPKNQFKFNLNSSNNEPINKLNSIFKPNAFSFLPSVQVNYDTGNVINDFAPAIAVSKNGYIYIVWNGDESNKSILFSRSTDGGKTFSPAIKINDDVVYPPSYSVYQPDIALDSNDNIYIVWHDYRSWVDDVSYTSPIDIYIDKSTDNGLTWGTDINVTNGISGIYYPWYSQSYITIDRSNNQIYVSYTDNSRYWPEGDAYDICVSTSTDGGSSFSPKVRVDDSPDSLLANQTFSSIAVDNINHNLYVVFDDTRNGSKDIYLAKSVDNGQTFSVNVLVNSDTTNDQEEPSIKIDNSGSVYVVWKDWSSDTNMNDSTYYNDIRISKSTDAGNSFATSVKINDDNLKMVYSYNYPPRLAIDDSDNVHVTWFDSRFNYTNCFYDESTDGGQTFAEDAIVNDNRDSLSHSLPRIAVDKNNVYIVYMDKRNGNNFYDIFFTSKDIPTNTENFFVQSPNNFNLEQNYPNPFNPTTTITYSIQEPGLVTIKVFDLIGQKVADLVNEEKESGSYSINFNASNLPSGIYIYTIKAGSFNQTRKMILMK